MSELEITKVFQNLNLPQSAPPPPSPPPQPEKGSEPLVYFPISGASAPLDPPQK